MFESDILAGDVAIVTGAGRNIGEEIALTYAEHGAKVVVVDKNEQRAHSTVAQINERGGEAISIITDISREEDVTQMVTQVQSEFGGIDILVNNASIRDTEGLFGLSIEEFDKVVAVNLRGTFLCTREVAKVMRESDTNGRIINISSTSGKSGRANSIAYSTTKAGLLNFTRSTAKALAEHGVRVNTITPTRTGLRTLGTEYEHRKNDPDIDHQIAQDILVKRLGEPRDIAMTALFLVTPASEFINGTEILVDGGRSA